MDFKAVAQLMHDVVYCDETSECMHLTSGFTSAKIGRNIIVLGGYTNNIYVITVTNTDVLDEKYTITKEFTLPFDIAHPAICVIEDRVVISGGISNNVISNKNYIIDTNGVNLVIEPLPDLQEPIYGHMCFMSTTNVLYIAGGDNGLSQIRDAYTINTNPVVDTTIPIYTAQEMLPTPYFLGDYSVVDNKLFCITTASTDNTGNNISLAWFTSSVNDTYTHTTIDVPTPRYFNPVLAKVNDNILILGGNCVDTNNLFITTEIRLDNELVTYTIDNKGIYFDTSSYILEYINNELILIPGNTSGNNINPIYTTIYNVLPEQPMARILNYTGKSFRLKGDSIIHQSIATASVKRIQGSNLNIQGLTAYNYVTEFVNLPEVATNTYIVVNPEVYYVGLAKSRFDLIMLANPVYDTSGRISAYECFAK